MPHFLAFNLADDLKVKPYSSCPRSSGDRNFSFPNPVVSHCFHHKKSNFSIFFGDKSAISKKKQQTSYCLLYPIFAYIYILWIFPLFPQSQQSFTSFMIPASWHIFWTFNLTHFSKIRLNIGKTWRSVWHQIQNLLQNWISWRQRQKKWYDFEAFWKEL